VKPMAESRRYTERVLAASNAQEPKLGVRGGEMVSHLDKVAAVRTSLACIGH
jgi:hypothetical protein